MWCTVSGMLMSWYTTRRGQEKRPTVPEPSRSMPLHADHAPCGNSWFVNKKKFGHLKPHGSINDPHIYYGVESVPNMYKLQDKDGKVVRPQENHALELADFIFRFCPPTGTMLDFCEGTLAAMLACFLLNRQGIFNDRDKECVTLATVRAKKFLYHHVKNFGVSYPEVNVPNDSKDNLLDPYKAFREKLGKPIEAYLHAQRFTRHRKLQER